MKTLAQKLKSHHHFTLLYCPCINGSVEVVCRELLRTCRALLSEFQVPYFAWAAVLPLIQSALNSMPTRKLNGKCPLTVFTGLPQHSLLSAILRNPENLFAIKDIYGCHPKALIKIEKLQKALDDIYRICADRGKKRRQSAVHADNRRTGIKSIDFMKGE